MLRYQNYVFDFYGTLVDIHTKEDSRLFWKRLAEIYACYGVHWEGQKLAKEYQKIIARKEADLKKMTGVTYPEIKLEEVFLELLGEDAIEKKEVDPESFAFLFSNLFRILSRKKCVAYPNTIPMLKALKEQGARIYLLSNAQAIFTRPEIERAGVGPYLDELFLSSDYGMKKPEAAFLEKVLEKYQLKKEETVMIGNDYYSDMAIAAKVGIDGIYLNTFQWKEEQEAEAIRHLKTINAAFNPYRVSSGDLGEIKDFIHLE